MSANARREDLEGKMSVNVSNPFVIQTIVMTAGNVENGKQDVDFVILKSSVV